MVDSRIPNIDIQFEEQTQSSSADVNMQDWRRKRNREEYNEEEWTEINKIAQKKSKITQNLDEFVQICVSSKQLMPKQFALAKLFRDHNISGILKIKYVNHYKIHLTFDTECNAEKFLTCKVFMELGWRCQKTWEVGLSFGIIKNIENDLSEEEILKNITSDTEIISVKRLNRRQDDKWIPSTSCKIGFKGPNLPKYVYLLDLRIKVDIYEYPVTQCVRCWRFGHLKFFCPSNKVICPKCTKNHENCSTTSFKCNNCGGHHMSNDKECNVYKKEKNIREIMAEFNCSYRKAQSMLIPPSPPPLDTYEPLRSKHVYAPTNDFSYYGNNDTEKSPEREPTTSWTETFADKEKKKKKKKKKKRVQLDENVYAEVEGSSESEIINENENTKKEEEDRRQDFKTLIGVLLEKIKNIIFDKNLNLTSKLNHGVKIIIEWITLVVVNFCSGYPMVKNIFKCIFGDG